MTNRGGSRVGAGRPQDPNSLRSAQRGDKDWFNLPAAGRGGDPPPWPLSAPTDRELQVWADFWRKPQAVIWERDQLFELVGIFIRQFIEAETAKASAENRKTVRMMFADLYLTPDSLSRAKYRIVADEVVSKSAAPDPADAVILDMFPTSDVGA
jgi:hypothetical protein